MSAHAYTLQEVIDAATEREFLNLPRRIYAGDSNWVCPIEESVRKIFDPKCNDMFAGGEAVRWIARDEKGETAGRIAAFYNREQAALEEQPTGGCGFFEAIDDQQVADLLFDAARQWLSERGMEAMDGPINFGPRDSWWGLLVQGYDYQPLFENPYNPPYYRELFENYGFKNYFNQNTYVWDIANDDITPSAYERAERVFSAGYKFRHIEMNELDRAAEDVRQIYNKAWALFSGVKPMTREQAQGMMRAMKPIIDPNLVWFATLHDEPVGFFVMLPDLNRLIGRFDGKLGWWNKLRLMWDLKVARKCDRIFALIFGIAPEYHGRGVESGCMRAMIEGFLSTPACRYKTIEFAWIGDFNPVMNRMVESYICARKHKMHTTYRYLFDREKEFRRCPRMGVRRRSEQAADQQPKTIE